MKYNEKRVIILGGGRTGQAVRDFLKEKGAKVDLFDDRDDLSCKVDPFCEKFDFAVISPGVPLTNRTVVRLRESGVPILSELDLAYIHCKSKKIFAVSGTNGKTTTCRILHEMLSSVGKSYLVGNIGVPFISVVDSVGSKEYVVVEVSSFQIEQNTLFRPMIAALTNVGEDHLDRHGSLARYQELKLSFAQRAEMAVLNADDPVEANVKGVRYSISNPSADYYLAQRKIVALGKEALLPLPSRGVWFDLDFLCAFAVAVTACGMKKSFLRAYQSTLLPPYRNQNVGNLKGAEVINDSKGTNIDATLFALSRLGENAAIILGGSDKGEDYSRLSSGLKGVKRIYLTGANSSDIYAAVDGDVRERCLLMADLESCVRHFASDPLATLLFSPASASFDSYSNYEERGARFNEIVEKYRND